ncbi:hypothetical protein Pla163_01110 [Planctomycetes bacterium Pla163]|uniref:Uncharacterized protein n=1 Tax=Rohdeia mirabilis TaxID=2528008 RepID=A0A518CUW5_9BACT|nr:hypothetical protein Pla163_01110 [Planctomycetes bacterium Pla163]
MSEHRDENEFTQADLDSPAYRQRLMRKLNCLIAVLEVACAKVRRSLDGPGADVERLERIKRNLSETLEVCRKAKSALERRERLPENLPIQLQDIASFDPQEGGSRPFEPRVYRGPMIEMTSSDEMERFQRMGPIADSEILATDFDALARELQN